jgi:hypothetical protein
MLQQKRDWLANSVAHPPVQSVDSFTLNAGSKVLELGISQSDYTTARTEKM